MLVEMKKKDQKAPPADKPANKEVTSQVEIFKKKLENVEQRLVKVNAEIDERTKKGEDLGVLLMQRRSLASWRSRFQKRLKAS